MCREVCGMMGKAINQYPKTCIPILEIKLIIWKVIPPNIGSDSSSNIFTVQSTIVIVSQIVLYIGYILLNKTDMVFSFFKLLSRKEYRQQTSKQKKITEFGNGDESSKENTWDRMAGKTMIDG